MENNKENKCCENKGNCCEGKEKSCCGHGMGACCHNGRKYHILKSIIFVIVIIIAFCAGSQWGGQ